MKVLAVILLFSASFFSTQAQVSPTSIQLNEALELAQKANQQIRLAKIDEQIAGANLKQTEAIWLPQLNLSYTAMNTNNPLNAFGFKLQQANVTAADFNPALLNNPGATPNYLTQLSLQQPIINMDMLYMRKAAEKQTEVIALQTKRTTEAVKLQVTQVYLNLQFLYSAEAVTKTALATVQSIYSFTKNRFDQGLMQKSDLLNVEVQVKNVETQLNDIQSKIASASDQLGLLMNQPKGIVYVTSTLVLALPTTMVKTIPTDRSDFKAMETGLGIYDISIKGTKMSWLPRLNAFANYQLNDKKALGFNAGSYFAGVQLSWDILKGNQTKNKAATQIIEKSKLKEQYNSRLDQEQVALQSALRNLKDAQYKYRQLQKSIEQAEEALRILQNRYQQGLVSTNDILLAQTQLAQQKLMQAEAKLAEYSAINYYDFLTTVQ
ncbi:TolC family protein [Sediminibacterium sp.]|uniref:TolC family protein n=1 Tax=Sediminibacterium sp. TaxID=1917865 RepID=UPI0027351537|nr:TolC family protein [Sediminibacterium sp.]MDP3394727.1 TolC family protein [Sediminibacterium sp.]MDP3568562.1 TolC family protein [Sediminibacterium sp.]